MTVSEAPVSRPQNKRDGELRKAKRKVDLATGASLKAVEEKLREKRMDEQEDCVIVEINPNAEINDKMFVKQSITKSGIKTTVLAFPESLHERVLKIMCSVTESYREVVNFMLKNPTFHKDIQFLENNGIKQRNLAIMFYDCCGDDVEVFEITLFLFRYNFFSKEEILENLSSLEPIPFYNPEVLIDADSEVLDSGFSASDRSKTAKVPAEVLEKSMEERVAFVNDRFERLKVAVREDYLQRRTKTDGKPREYKLEP
jgi:hypothetical protein